MEEELGWIAMMVGVFVLAMTSVALQGFFSNLGSHLYHKFIVLLWGSDEDAAMVEVEEGPTVGEAEGDEDPEPECTIGRCWAGPGGVDRVERSRGVCRGACVARPVSIGGATVLAGPASGGQAMPGCDRAGVSASEQNGGGGGEYYSPAGEDGSGDWISECHVPVSSAHLEADGDSVEG